MLHLLLYNIDAPKPLKKRIKKCPKLSKSLSQKTKSSKGHEKARWQPEDARGDFIHKLTTEIICENQTIV